VLRLMRSARAMARPFMPWRCSSSTA
jgi:hypothetical protein